MMTDKKQLAEIVREAKEKYIYSDEIAQYLIERGVVVLPCEVGDRAWRVCHISPAIPDFLSNDVITKIGFATRGVINEQAWSFSDIGKTVFLTREEAEAKLKEKNNG